MSAVTKVPVGGSSAIFTLDDSELYVFQFRGVKVTTKLHLVPRL